MNTLYDLIILGAGASGLMAARMAGLLGLTTLVIDQAAQAGNKLSIAGGGKGNVTNRILDPTWYGGENPLFVRNALKAYRTEAVLDLLGHYAIPWEERDHGRIFCTVPSRKLAEALQEEAKKRGVRFVFGQQILSIEYQPQGDGKSFSLRTEKHSFHARNILIALGGPAWPQIGASLRGTELAHQLGHRCVPVRPVLAPLIMPESWPLHGLAGISCEARLAVAKRSFTDALLFTHKGLSGPAALQASCFLGKEEPLGSELTIDFLPQASVLELLHAPENGKLLTQSLFEKLLPSRLVQSLLPFGLGNKKVAELSKKERLLLEKALQKHTVKPLRSEGLHKAEASAGGVDTREVCPKTMRSLLCEQLYFAGEVLDVHGLLGGYNIHWAFASASAAVKAIKK